MKEDGRRRKAKTMTEQEWQECGDPDPMLDFLLGTRWDRKLRLFACACCRRIWHLLDEHGRGCVDGGERIAEGGSFSTSMSIDYAQSEAEGAALYTLQEDASFAACRAADLASAVVGFEAALEGEFSEYSSRILGERRMQSHLLQCIIGPLQFRPVLLDSSWLTWNNSTMLRLAKSIYEERQLPEGTLEAPRLSVLADALEEAGCAERAILNHLRGPGPHLRGCWPVDLVLAKK